MCLSTGRLESRRFAVFQNNLSNYNINSWPSKWQFFRPLDHRIPGVISTIPNLKFWQEKQMPFIPVHPFLAINSHINKNTVLLLRGAWRDRDMNDIFAHCSLIFYFLGFKFSNFVCPSELHPLIWFFFKNSFTKKKNIRKTTQNGLAPSIFIVLLMCAETWYMYTASTHPSAKYVVADFSISP